MTTVRTYLDSLDPRLWPLALALAAGALVWAWRRWHLASFDRLPRAVQALPAVLVAAALGGASGSSLVQMVIEAAAGGASGLLAIGGHHAGKAMRRED